MGGFETGCSAVGVLVGQPPYSERDYVKGLRYCLILARRTAEASDKNHSMTATFPRATRTRSL